MMLKYYWDNNIDDETKKNQTDLVYNFNELYIMVKTNVKISREIFL
jgi:hypothetical protein